MLLILLLLVLLTATCFGWGKAAGWLLRGAFSSSYSAVALIWLGWAFALLLLQVLHLFTPLSAYAILPVFFTGIVLCGFEFLPAARRFSQKESRPKPEKVVRLVCGGVLILAALWISARSLLPPTNYDSGLYHLTCIRWVNAYPIVPGLGNLHNRFAFNQSFFVYAAALNGYPFWGQGRSLANSFLALLTLATVLYALFPVLQKPSLLKENHPFRYAAALFVLPLLIYQIITTDGIASPTPDFASILLEITLFVVLAEGIAAWKRGERQLEHSAMLLAVLAASAITVKLSNFVFAAIVLMFCAGWAWQTRKQNRFALRRLGLVVGVILLVWGYRGFLLSGAPLYPSTLGYVATDWAMPRSEVIEESYWVYCWAKMPNTHWRHVLGNWNWLRPWFQRISHEATIVIPFGLSLVCSVLAVITLAWKKRRTKQPFRFLDAGLMLPALLAVLGWFFTAPDPRYAHVLFWLLLLSSALWLLSVVQMQSTPQAYARILGVVFLLVNFYFLQSLGRHLSMLKTVSTSGWHPAPSVPLRTERTASGLTVYTPILSDQCWDSPLPCTPYYSPNLRLRTPDNMASGFAPRLNQSETIRLK